jgi:hypothetical protein
MYLGGSEMKKISLTLVILLSLLAVQVVSADTPAPGGPFSTAFRVQNLEGTAASCTYTLYDASGTDVHTISPTTVQPGDSMFVYTPNIVGLASGTYSAVVSCDKQVAAVANWGDADSGASFNGVSSPGTTWYAPGIYDDYYDYYSTIIVQNTTGSTVDIDVEIYAPGSSSPTTTQSATSVPAYASVSFEQEGLGALSDNVPYSAKIIATGEVGAIVNIYGRVAYDGQLFSYNAFAAGDTTFYAPVIMNNYYGYDTALVVQNIGAETTHITVSYATGETQEQDLASNSAATFYTPVSGIPSGDGPGLNSATITSTTAGFGAQPIVVLVNESNSYNRAASYVGFSSGGTEVRAPALEKRYYAFNSSMTCQIISGGPATMTIEYFGAGGSSLGTTVSPSKSTGETHVFYIPNETYIPDGWLGSAKVTSTADIVCIVNQDMNEPPESTTSMDQLYSYEGIIP